MRAFSSLVLFVLLGTGLGLAQTSTGTISGRVLDPAGQAVPGAQATLTKQDTRETRTFTSDGAGEFTFTRSEERRVGKECRL